MESQNSATKAAGAASVSNIIGKLCINTNNSKDKYGTSGRTTLKSDIIITKLQLENAMIA